MTIRRLLLLLLLTTPIHSLSIFHRIRRKVLPFTLPWYESGLQFSCTSCGKCCKVDGDIWLSPSEVDTIQAHLGIKTVDEFKRQYGRAEVSDGKDSWVCLKRNECSCVFLNPLGQCGIYDVRPVQCSTYPFWPSLLASKEDWEDEAVVPDDIELKGGERYWSTELGGCEGITLQSKSSSNDEETIVDRKEIKAKMKAAKRHWDSFPIDDIKQSTWYL